MIQVEVKTPASPDVQISVNHDRITVENTAELNYWCNRFSLTAEELKEIIQDLGRSPLAMEKYLNMVRKYE